MLVSFRDRQYRALCQGGVANKIADTLVWALFPIFYRIQGLKLAKIGRITGLYAMVWGLSQLWTGHLADRIGRKPTIVAGFLLLAGGIAVTALGTVPIVWFVAAAIMGLGMALLYPNLIAAMSDLTPPLWRGKALGTYRYWRDTGYAIGALLLGLVAQVSDAVRPAMWLTAMLVAGSGLWIAFGVKDPKSRDARAHSSPHYVAGMELPNMPLLRSISVNRRIRGSSRCFGMFGINS
ncbi:MFS transporter [Acidiphilium sp. PA]|uniref:MFS transporter n=1 Tax=Acidiphilium sp. PA TaxID=2871705 RepID=UPI002243B2D4|nr:MFS transporter [Acidiphilium sp. PA]MCW8308854.1 MFS transporter [Acidiphilium sp. PA]